MEFGVENGDQCNTRMLREHYNFTGLLMDGGFENEHLNLRREFLTVDNIVELFRKYNVPHTFDLLSIDLDMFDFWILEKILHEYTPRIIVAEVNPTLGHNIHNQNHEYFMNSFRELNSLPLGVNHPKCMEQEVWDGTRYSGANPVAFQTLLKEFGYEMVYCESCGVNCFFILKSLFPESCTGTFPTPMIHYPCYGTGQAGIMGHKSDLAGRDPVLLTTDLVRKIIGGDIDKIITDHFASHLYHLDRRKYADPNEISMPSDKCTTQSFGSEFLDVCNCLDYNMCDSPGDVLAAKLDFFLSYFETYSTVSEPKSPGIGMSEEPPTFVWTCYMLRQLKNSSICEDLGYLFYQQSLNFIQSDLLRDAMSSLLEGLKFAPRSRDLLHLLSYFELYHFMMETSGEVYSLDFIDIMHHGEVKVIGLGAGVCDNIRYRTQHHATLSDHHLELHDTLFETILQQSLGGFLTATEESVHTPKVRAVDDISFGFKSPFYEQDNLFSSKYTPPCYSENLFTQANYIVNRICHKRRFGRTFLIIEPPLSAFIKHSAGSHLRTHDSAKSDSALNIINDIIMKYIGCDTNGKMWSVGCKGALKLLSSGFLPQSTDSAESNRFFWKNITQSIYGNVLKNADMRILADPLLSFMAPIWKDPLGTVDVLVPLTLPSYTVCCMAESENTSLEDAADHYLFHFYSMLESVKSFENVSFFPYFSVPTEDGGELNDILHFDTSVVHDFNKHHCTSCDYRSSYVNSSHVLDLVPLWVYQCVDALLRGSSWKDPQCKQI